MNSNFPQKKIALVGRSSKHYNCLETNIFILLVQKVQDILYMGEDFYHMILS